MNFWQRWIFAFIMMLPVTSISSCFVAFMVAGELRQGLMVWFGEAGVFGLLLATCRDAEVWRDRE